MFKEKYSVVGVMSGTSLDGIDLAHVNFYIKNYKWTFELFECETVAYNNFWLNKLKIAVDFNSHQLVDLNNDYTLYIGTIINEFISNNKLQNLDAICSHGHTILHQPEKGFTLQIGNLPEIATITKNNVICDFRVQDLELGGQGAPLVPIGDQLLFSEFDYCLNLGGFSNISYQENKQRIAFDISPVNTVLNFYANKLGFEYDDKGKIASSGKINNQLLEKLNNLEFYFKNHPKSLGVEFVNQTILPLIENHELLIEDKLATFTEHIAHQISNILFQKQGKLLITGGGAYNEFLISKIKFHNPEIQIIIPDKKVLEFKEALIFAFLGVLKLRNEVNVLKSVTGALQDHSSGKVFLYKQ
jgi:anhydro-N-acetylmuramic acid kinase